MAGSSQSSQPSQVPQPREIAPFDVCGYCGQQFSNYPKPDWFVRGQHLTTEHKFAECNQSKKFFRADHFRQHLKHSHGGTSGKWTNMLEAACMKDEPSVTAEAQAQNAHAIATQQSQQHQQRQAPSHSGQAPSSATGSPSRETQLHGHVQAHSQAPAQQAGVPQLPASQLQAAPMANMMHSVHYPMMAQMSGPGRGNSNGADFPFTSAEDFKREQRE